MFENPRASPTAKTESLNIMDEMSATINVGIISVRSDKNLMTTRENPP